MSKSPMSIRSAVGKRLRWSAEGALMGLAAWGLGILALRLIRFLGS